MHRSWLKVWQHHVSIRFFGTNSVCFWNLDICYKMIVMWLKHAAKKNTPREILTIRYWYLSHLLFINFYPLKFNNINKYISKSYISIWSIETLLFILYRNRSKIILFFLQFSSLFKVNSWFRIIILGIEKLITRRKK